jgi:hypothetical protein
MTDTVEDFFADVKTVSKLPVDSDTVSSFFDADKVEEKDETLPTVKDGSLKVDDIVATQKHVDAIRDYMVDRKGKQFMDMDKEKLVDKFVTHMRYFNTNEAFTIDEARYVTLADKDKKARAGKAYQVYDRLGNVFVNDGFYGAVGGVADYLGAVASSPSTYFGLGVGKALTLGGGKLGAKFVKEKAKAAVRDTLRKAATENIGKEARKKLAIEAYDDVIKKAVRGRSLRNIGITGGADAATALGQDYLIQTDIEKATGVREDYSFLQGGLSALGSGIGTGLSVYGVPKVVGADRKDLTGSAAKQILKANQIKQQDIKSQEAREKFNNKYLAKIRRLAAKKKENPSTVDEILKTGKKLSYDYEGFSELAQGKITDPKLAEAPTFEPELTAFLLGKAEDSPTENIITLALEAGAKFRPGMNPAQMYSRAFQFLSKEALTEVSELTKSNFGVYLGDVLDTVNFTTNLGKKLAATASHAGKNLRLFQLDGIQTDKNLAETSLSILRQNSKLAERTKTLGDKPRTYEKYGGYLQNVWKRALVSAPQTTAVNVLGFSQMYLATTAQEVLQATAYGLTGDIGKFKSLLKLQTKKLKNLFDPYSTFDNYQAILKTDPVLQQLLTETVAGGVERTAKRFDFDKESKGLKLVEGLTNFSQTISLVNLQDTVTKSQMFMNSIDKYLRIQKNKTLDDVLQSGTLFDLDDDIYERAMGDTLKSVFAEDYTKSEKLAGLVGGAARAVEGASRFPGIGFILPFGRFMNNVVATTYRYSPLAFLDAASAIAKGSKIDTIEAVTRATVGSAALLYAAEFQKEQEKKGYQWFELETGSGEVTDITNTFPLSLLMITGRVANRRNNGDFVDRDLVTEFGKQIAIGQAATDLQFGNDITRIIQLGFNADGDFKSPFKISLETGLYGLGNVAAGFTRPLDVVNKLSGYAAQTLTPYDITPQVDRRLAKGPFEKFGYNATKYVDNIIEGMASGLKGETVLLGDELRVAAREGSVFDPSPYRTMTGTRIKQPRTFANIVFGMVDKPEWKTGMYTGVPEHDNFANKVLAPLIEKEAELLLKDSSFLRGSYDDKKTKVNAMLNSVKNRVRKYLADIPETEQGLDYRKTKLDNVSKLLMKRARKIAEIQDVDLRDLTEGEVSKLEAVVDYLRDKDRGD